MFKISLRQVLFTKPLRVVVGLVLTASAPLVALSAPEPEGSVDRLDDIRLAEKLIPVRNREQVAGRSQISVAEQKASSHALRAALDGWLANPRAHPALYKALEQNPHSPWAASIWTNLGLHQFRDGYLLRALDCYERAWAAGKDESTPEGRAAVDRALGELAALLARLGRFERLGELLLETQERPVRGAATELLAGARQGLSLMLHRPSVAFKCGPLALDQILRSKNQKFGGHPLIRDAASTQKGTSLAQVAALATQVGLKMQPAHRTAGAQWLFPSVLHWKAGHFAALIRPENSRYLIEDTTFKESLLATGEALEEETSGYFLVPDGPLPPGWRKVEIAEAGTVWGKGQVNTSDPWATKANDIKVRTGRNPCGMAVYNFHALLASLTIEDVPVGYAPPVGPALFLKLTYNQRESVQTTNTDWTTFGPKWTHNWFGFVQRDPLQSNSLPVALPGGGAEFHSFSSRPPHPQSQAVIEDMFEEPPPPPPSVPALIGFRRKLPDGSSQEFTHRISISVPGGTASNYFLTKVVDVQGNEVNLSYAVHRLKFVQSSVGGSLEFRYHDEFIGPRPIGFVDPGHYFPEFVFDSQGHGAYFTYDSSGRLKSISDAVNVTSTFVYQGGSDFIEQLITPYGTTTFTKTEQFVTRNGPNGPVSVSARRGIQATDSGGNSEYLEYYDADGTAALPIPPGVTSDESPVPVGVNIRNQNSPNFPAGQTLHFRNSYYWNKKAFQTQPLDYTKAHVFHWLHSNDFSSAVGYLESEKPPHERRIWYNYQGQEDAVDINGTVYTGSAATLFSTSLVSKIGRVVGDINPDPLTDSQLTQLTYNSLGHPTQMIDAEGRTFTFIYDTNQIDLLEVRNTRAGQNVLLLKLSNYFKHRPQTITDADGNVTQITYNARGQATTVTNARNEVTEYQYDPANGFLEGVAQGGTWSGGQVTGGKLVASYLPLITGGSLVGSATTGSSGIPGGMAYTVSYLYNGLGQMTKATHPDGTFEQWTYNKLDPEWIRDRAGRLTRVLYDYDRRPYQITGPLQRVTTLDWCGCGQLKGIIDGELRETRFEYDTVGRITKKLFHDGQFWTFDYDAGSRRLKQRIDGRNQVTKYGYFRDDRLKEIIYENPIAPTPNVSFTYDPDYGRPITRTDGQGTTTFEYHPFPATPGAVANGAGQLWKLKVPLPGGGIDEVRFNYDEVGRTDSTQVAGHWRVLSHDELGRPIADISDVLGTFVTQYLQNTDFPDVVKLNGNIWKDYSWQTAAQGQRLTQIKNHVPSVGGPVISQFDYGYDAVGNVTSWTTQRPSSPVDGWTLVYDPADQLLRTVRAGPGSGGWSQKAYIYDGGAHRSQEQQGLEVTKIDDKTDTSKWKRIAGSEMRVWGAISNPGTVSIEGVSALVNSQLQFEGVVSISGPGPRNFNITATNPEGTVTSQNFTVNVSTGSGGEYSLDANSNVASVSNGGPVYTWDAEDRLVKIVQGTSESNFEYDGLNRIVREVEKQNGSVVSDRRFLWAGFERVAERSTSGALVKLFYPQGFWVAATSQAYLYGSDHLDSVRDVYTPSGTVAGSYDYDPYGRLSVVGTETVKADFGFTGHWRHDVTGQSTLWQAPLRSYDPGIGRWLSRDPIGEAGGLDLHGYVANNPTTFTDSLGLWCDEKVLGAPRGNPTQVLRNLQGKGPAPATATGGRMGGGSPPKKKSPPGFPGDESEEHHWLPREFKTWFAAAPRGLNIENFTQSIPMQWHRGAKISLHSRGFNRMWREFIRKNPNASREQTVDALQKIKDALGFGG